LPLVGKSQRFPYVSSKVKFKDFLASFAREKNYWHENLIQKVHKLITEMEIERDDLTCMGKG